MTPDRKLETYKTRMATEGIGESTAFPPLWRLLWAMGWHVAPPPFMGFFALVIVTGGAFGVLFTALGWVMVHRSVHSILSSHPGWTMLASGAVFGLAMAVYYRALARRCGLRSWADV